jgi:hypothetical protein
MYTATVLDVLIASPGDTAAQREIIRRAVVDWNISNSRVFGVVLLPVMWETHSLPGLGGRPQGMINQQLVNDADILIATFWTKLGSPTGEADSGTVEEINKFREAKRPVHLYFCEMPVSPFSTNAEQLEGLKQFREEISAAGLYSSYANDEELRIKVRDDLTKRIHTMQQEGLLDRPASTETVVIPDSDEMPSTETEPVERLEAVRQGLKGYMASWAARYASLDDFSVDQYHDLMGSVATTLYEIIRQVATIDADSAVLPQLQEIASAAAGWANFRIYIDGGVTFGKLNEGCRSVLDAIRRVVAEAWN